MNTLFYLKSPTFSEKIIGWYMKNMRDLPWRNTKEPYQIWLSEVILQQTRVAQGLPYFLRFIEAFPTVQLLAMAKEEEVLRLWQGLGYYLRARNMHATAGIIANTMDGNFPNTYKGLIALKGIGPYTAAAIASFSFNECVPVIDGNVFRVLSRVFGITTDISSPSARNEFGAISQKLIPSDNPATFNQAIMEFGALLCTPKKPNCPTCPVQAGCFAFKNQAQGRLPVKLKKASVTSRYFHYFAIKSNETYLLKKRTKKDIWEGLYDFYLTERPLKNYSIDDLDDTILNKIQTKASTVTFVNSKKHVLSHQRIYADFWLLELNKIKQEELLKLVPKGYNFYSIEEIKNLPKSALTTAFVEKLCSKSTLDT